MWKGVRSLVWRSRSWAVLVATVSTAVCLALAACGTSPGFTGYGAGLYPPGVTYAERQYSASVYEETLDAGSWFDVTNKDVWIRVEDPQGHRFLNDFVGHMRARLVVGRVTWKEFDALEVRLYEVVHDGTYEYQDMAVEPHAPHARFLARYTYRYDKQSKQFVRVK